MNFIRILKDTKNITRRTMSHDFPKEDPIKFETVFALPSIKFISLINRCKVYQLAGTGVAIPCSGILEMTNLIAEQSFFTTCYIGLTASALLSLATLPFRNIIGFLYVSENNELVKISSVDFWGKRVDKIVDLSEWIPLMDLPIKNTDALYLSPKLTDGTEYKLLLKMGKVLNVKKISDILE